MASDRAAYRALLRLCRRLDREPVLQTALIGRPARRYHPGLQKLVRVPPGKYPFVDDAVWETCGRSTEFAHAQGSAARAAKLHRQRAALVGFGYLDEATEFRRRLERAEKLFHTIRRASDNDPGETPFLPSLRLQHLPASSEEPVKEGDVLLTHPLACLLQPQLDQAVIIIEEVNKEAGYVRGLTINKRSTSMAEMLDKAGGDDHQLVHSLGMPWLLSCTLHIGGDLVPLAHVGNGEGQEGQQKGAEDDQSKLRGMVLLHSLADLPGARNIGPGMWIGGDLRELARRVEAGNARTEEVRPIYGFAGWASEQLELELQRGVWVRARTPSADSLWSLFEASGSDKAGRDVWAAAMSRVGFPHFAAFPRGEAGDVDVQLRAFFDDHTRAHVQELLDWSRSHDEQKDQQP